MIYRKHTGYDAFSCIADKCPENCCSSWQIVIDEESLARYRKEGRTGIDYEEGTFLQKKGRCSMLRPDGLCSLQCELGEEALCRTCRQYPRHTEEFEGEREYSLSLSCPEAARLLLSMEEPMTFTETEDAEEESFEEYDYFLDSVLCSVRECCYRIARDRSLPLPERFRRLLNLGEEVQQLADSDRLCDVEELLAGFSGTEAGTDYFRKPEEAFEILYSLERLSDGWLEDLNRAVDFMENADYRERKEQLLERYRVPGEQLLMLFLYTYLRGAVYDGEIRSKIAFSVYSVKWIFDIFGGQPEDTPEMLCEISWRYAREVEHSDENLMLVLRWLDGESEYASR